MTRNKGDLNLSTRKRIAEEKQRATSSKKIFQFHKSANISPLKICAVGSVVVISDSITDGSTPCIVAATGETRDPGIDECTPKNKSERVRSGNLADVHSIANEMMTGSNTRNAAIGNEGNLQQPPQTLVLYYSWNVGASSSKKIFQPHKSANISPLKICAVGSVVVISDSITDGSTPCIVAAT